MAAGWGMCDHSHFPPYIVNSSLMSDFGYMRQMFYVFFRYSHDDKRQSPMLKRVNLKVSTKSFKHTKMLGTLVEKKNGVYQDPCAGDSGGPLMYKDKNSGRWILIGQSRIVDLET